MNTFHSYVRTPPPMLFVDDFLTVPLDITTPPSIRTAPASPVATPLNISHSSLTKVDNSLSSSTPSTPSKSFHSSHNSQPSHFQTPPNSSHIRPSFDARDKALSDFFFQKPSKLLSQYTKILLTKDVQTYHINVIVEYFASRNNLEQLLIELVTEEIETTNINNQLFRGNNTFTRAYSVYLKMYCNDYLNKTSIAFLDYLKETGFNDDHLDSTEKHSIDLKDSIVTLYCTLLLDNVSLIPTHMRLLIKHVYEKILNKRGELEANKAVSTLLFLRYLLVPFVASPNLFKCVQCFVTQVINEMSPGCSQECFFEETLFNTKQLLNSLMKGNISGHSNTSNIEQSERTFFQMVELLKEHKKRFTELLGDDSSQIEWIISGKKRNTSLSFITRFF